METLKVKHVNFYINTMTKFKGEKGGRKKPKTTPARKTLRAQKQQRKANKAKRAGKTAKANRLNKKAQSIRKRK